MRIWRIRYTGYHAYSYNQPFINDPDQNVFLTLTAAEAHLPIPLSKADQKEERQIGPHVHFQIYEDEISNYQFFLIEFNERMDRGEIVNIWSRERWWQNYGQHQVYANATDPRLVEFFDHASNRVTTMKPGKYLKKYYSDILTDRQIAFNAEFWTTGKKPELPLTLHFATTEEDILRVYMKGPKSCMKGSSGVTAYAAGDLAIAYVTNAEDKIVGRCICWPDRKIYGRIYPDDRNWEHDGFESRDESQAVAATLASMLRAQEYVNIQEKPDGFDGARIKVEPLPGYESEGYIKMPYLDNDLRLEFTADREFRLKKDGDIRSAGTGGHISLLESECAVCSLPAVANADRTDNRVCRNFYDYEHNEARYRPIVCSSCAKSEHVTRCDATEQLFLNSETEFVEVFPSRHSTEPNRVVREYFEQNGWTSDGDGRSYLNYNVSPRVINGKRYHADELLYSRKLDKYFVTDEERKAAEAKAVTKHKPVKLRPFQLQAA